MLRYKIRNGGLGYKPKFIWATVRVCVVSSLFFPLRRRQVFIFVVSLRITMKTPLGNAPICFADGSSGKQQTGHWHFTCMKTNTSTYYHINTSAAQPNYRGQSLLGIFQSPHFQAENTFFRFANVNGGWQVQTVTHNWCAQCSWSLIKTKKTIWAVIIKGRH